MNSKAVSFVLGLIILVCLFLVGVRSVNAEGVTIERPEVSAVDDQVIDNVGVMVGGNKTDQHFSVLTGSIITVDSLNEYNWYNLNFTLDCDNGDSVRIHTEKLGQQNYIIGCNETAVITMEAWDGDDLRFLVAKTGENDIKVKLAVGVELLYSDNVLAWGSGSSNGSNGYEFDIDQFTIENGDLLTIECFSNAGVQLDVATVHNIGTANEDIEQFQNSIFIKMQDNGYNNTEYRELSEHSTDYSNGDSVNLRVYVRVQSVQIQQIAHVFCIVTERESELTDQVDIQGDAGLQVVDFDELTAHNGRYDVTLFMNACKTGVLNEGETNATDYITVSSGGYYQTYEAIKCFDGAHNENGTQAHDGRNQVTFENVMVIDGQVKIRIVNGYSYWLEVSIHGELITENDTNDRTVHSYVFDAVQFGDGLDGGSAVLELDGLQDQAWYKLDIMLDCDNSQYDQMLANGQNVDCGQVFTLYGRSQGEFLEIVFNRWGMLQTMTVNVMAVQL